MSEALLLGCSDYLREPWESGELAARLSRAANSLSFSVGGMSVRLEGFSLTAGGRTLTLEDWEAGLLRALLLSGGEPVERKTLAALLGSAADRTAAAAGEERSRAVDMRISRLRRRLADFLDLSGSDCRLVESVYGTGYRLSCG